jgi:hypothetical protein
MPAAKFVLIGLFAASCSTVGHSETSANVLPSAAQDEWGVHSLVAMQHGAQQAPWDPLFTDEQPAVPGTAPASEKWLVALLFVGLAAYQLRRNQRSLSHRLSSH